MKPKTLDEVLREQRPLALPMALTERLHQDFAQTFGRPEEKKPCATPPKTP
jgi:hypothetical protein